MNLIGVYYPGPGRSFWHTLDPRSKILTSLALMTALFWGRGIQLGLVCLLVFMLYPTSRLPWRLAWGGVQRFKWLLLVAFLANLLLPLRINDYLSSLIKNLPGAVEVMLRLAAVLLVASWFGYVTTPLAVVEGLTRLFRPFSRLYLGRLDLPLMMGLVTRFVPELFVESENIIIAQRIRGIRPGFTLKNSAKWVKSTIIPLFLAGIRKAAVLAVAIESRGYRPGAPKSETAPLRLTNRDLLVIGCSILFILWRLVQIW